MGLGPEALTKLQPPAKLRDLGISPGLAEDLFCRRVLAERTTTVGKASHALGISHAVANEIATSLREKALLEYQGLDGRDYRITLTELGFRTTAERMKTAQHVASMPIPIEDYQAIVKLQQSDVHLDRVLVKKAFADMVVEDNILDQLGPAFVSGGAIFIYGPPGTGKTSLAERMCRFYNDLVLIPKFTAVDGQLISVFDPAIHRAVPEQPAGLDPRYVLCERPLIMVGGELNLEMMDLRYDPISGLSSAPIQMLANNGILVVDDFGRQTTSPEEILNRWIIPLSRGVDFLKPNSGTKFTVPFELKLVVSTNLEPNALGDDAFLRRLRHKVFVGPCTDTAFNWILVRAADRHEIKVNADSAKYLNIVTREHLGELRPYVAIDFCELAVSICSYDGLPMVLDRPLIDRVADLCFVKDPDDPSIWHRDPDDGEHERPADNEANGVGSLNDEMAPFTAMGDHLTSSSP
ncbi:MAG: AAA family ATPase [Acidimicrobiia bacterium]|nr:AAA family ATPase [Acidimicrobiia bacterium]